MRLGTSLGRNSLSDPTDQRLVMEILSMLVDLLNNLARTKAWSLRSSWGTTVALVHSLSILRGM